MHYLFGQAGLGLGGWIRFFSTVAQLFQICAEIISLLAFQVPELYFHANIQ
jgi:hypothetical protein